MKANIRFTKKDVFVVLGCVVFLLTNLAVIGSGGRRRAMDLVCRSNLQQWAAVFAMYANDNGGKFPPGWYSGVMCGERWFDCMRSYFDDNNDLLCCPTAVTPRNKLVDEMTTVSTGGQGKTTAQMQTMSTFTDAGWDFLAETANGIEDIWRLCQDGTDYPKLAWQMIMLGDFVCGDGVRFNDLDIFMKQWLMEKLSADVSPARGDGMVDFLDWAVFANTLQNTVDLNDVAVFAGQWLRLGAYCADIAPSPDGDGVVDMLDFAVLAEHWLGGPG